MNEIINTKFKKDNDLNEPLPDKEKEILDFIKENPGKSKEEIIRHFKDKSETNGYSRNPMYKTFDTLKKYNLIVIRKNPNNKQTNSIFINDNNLLNDLIQDIDFVKIQYLELLNRLEDNFTKSNDDIDLISDTYNVVKILFYFYKFFLDIYFVNLSFFMPQKTSDSSILNKSYSIFFSEISQVLLKMSSLYFKCYLKLCSLVEFSKDHEIDSFGQYIDIMIRNTIFDIYMLEGNLDQYIDSSNRLGFEDRIKTLIDFIWKLYNDIIQKNKQIKI